MTAYQIIACDMDETLLSSDATICRRNIEAIAAARRAGVKFVPATGRGYASLEGVLKSTGLWQQEKEYVISFNGCCITENKSNRRLYWNPLPFTTAAALYEKGIAYGLCLHAYTANTVYIYRPSTAKIHFLNGRMAFTETTERSLDFLAGQDIVKLIYMHPDMTYLQNLQKELQPLLRSVCVSFSSNRYLEFANEGVTKAAALYKLADLLHVPYAETLAIGDNINDAAMLRAAGLGVGVANLHEAIREDCDVVTAATNNEGAVAEAITRFVLNHT